MNDDAVCIKAFNADAAFKIQSFFVITWFDVNDSVHFSRIDSGLDCGIISGDYYDLLGGDQQLL